MHTGLTAGISWLAKKAVKENFNCWSQQECHELREVHCPSDGCSHRSEKNTSRIKKSSQKRIYRMASVAIMAGGAVLNAVAFIGGNYLARFFRMMIQRLPSKK